MKKTFISGFILCFIGTFSMSSMAQEYKNFDLSKYYTPDIVRNQLDFSGSGSGAANSTENTYPGNTNDQNLSGNLNSSFSNTVNTRSLIRSLNASLSLGGNSASSLDNTKINRYGENLSNGVNIGAYYQLYNTNKQFISFGGSGGYALRSQRRSTTDSLDRSDSNNYNNFYGMLSLNVGAGIGRIENVTDAQQTVYLLDAFTKNKVLNRDLSENEIFLLSQKISLVKNKRFLDSRLHLMDEISQVDTFFMSNNLITKQDARYFTTLYDIWLYGDKFERRAGQKIELSLTPYFTNNYNYSKSTYTIPTTTSSNYESNSNGSNVNYQLSLLYQYEKPFLQKWQHSLSASLNGNYTIYSGTYKNVLTDEKANNSNSTKHIYLNAEYTLGFYPNTRTNLYAKVNEVTTCLFDYSQSLNNITTSYDQKSLTNTVGFELGAYYYFSPQLRVTASATIRNRHYIEDLTDLSKLDNQFNSSFSIGCTYSLF